MTRRPKSTGVEIIVVWIGAVGCVAAFMGLFNAPYWLSLVAGAATTLIVYGIAAKTKTEYYDRDGRRIR